MPQEHREPPISRLCLYNSIPANHYQLSVFSVLCKSGLIASIRFSTNSMPSEHDHQHRPHAEGMDRALRTHGGGAGVGAQGNTAS